MGILVLGLHSNALRAQEESAEDQKIVTVSAQAEMILQGLLNSDSAIKQQNLLGLATAQEGDIMDGTIGSQIQFQARVGDYFSGFASVELGEGNGLDSELTTISFFNFDAQSASKSATIDQLWVRGGTQYVSFLFGQVDWIRQFDTNAVANSEVYQFLTRSFVTNPVIYGPNGSANTSQGANRFNTLSLMAIITPSENLEFKYAVFENDGDMNKIEPKDLVHFAELDMKWGIGENPGNLRVLYTENDGAKTLFTDGTSSTDTIASVTVNADQAVGRVSFFGRYGTVLDNRAGMFFSPYTTSMTMPNWHLSGGLSVKELPLRGEFGLAYGFNHLPTEWQNRITNAGGTTNPQDADKGEQVGEIYYRMKVNDLVSIIPDLIYIQSPAGVEDCKALFAYSTRVVVDF